MRPNARSTTCICKCRPVRLTASPCNRAGRQAANVAVPDVIRSLGQVEPADLAQRLFLIEDSNLDPRCDRGVHRKVHSAPVELRPERIRVSRPNIAAIKSSPAPAPIQRPRPRRSKGRVRVSPQKLAIQMFRLAFSSAWKSTSNGRRAVALILRL